MLGLIPSLFVPLFLLCTVACVAESKGVSIRWIGLLDWITGLTFYFVFLPRLNHDSVIASPIAFQ